MPKSKKPAEQFDSEVSDLWAILDKMGDQADSRTIRMLNEVRKHMVDRLLALPGYQLEPGGPDVVPAQLLVTYLDEVESILRTWAQVALSQNDIEGAADLGTHGYTNALRALAGLPASGITSSMIGLTPDLVAAALNYRAASFKQLAAATHASIAEEMQKVIFGQQSRWDAVVAIRKELDTSHDGLGKATKLATKIERTALISIFNAASAKTLTDAEKDLPSVMKEWSAAHQKSTCERCRRLNGKRVKPKETFERGILAPPLHFQCRCRVVAWMPEWDQ